MPRKPGTFSDAERAAMSARMKALWARGVWADRHLRPPDAWTAAHDRRLRQLVGTRTLAEIAATLTAEFPGTPRTATAVRVRCTRLGLSGTVNAYTAIQVAGIFGVDPTTPTRSWLARGWLAGTQLTPGQPRSQWLITAAQVEAFIRQYRHAYDWRRMPRGQWRNLAELVWRADPLLSLADARRYSGLSERALCRALATGALAGYRQGRPAGTGGGTWRVARSALRAWLARTEGAA